MGIYQKPVKMKVPKEELSEVVLSPDIRKFQVKKDEPALVLDATKDDSADDPEEEKQGLLKRLSKAIGLDITAIAIPVSFCEPTSFLQRLAEPLEYRTLLNKAAATEDPIERQILVTAFVVSTYSQTERTKKPFNPMLGETYEYVGDDFKFLAEQVSHHPPIGAAYADSENWSFWSQQEVKTKFTGNSLELLPKGSLNVYLKKTDELFTWGHIKTIAHNVVMGKLWVDHTGTLTITNKKSGATSVLEYLPCGFMSKNHHYFTGVVNDASGKEVAHVAGKWQEFFAAKTGVNPKDKDGKKYWDKLMEEGRRLWKHTGEAVKDHKFKFPPFVIELTKCTKLQQKTLPSTDSRLRPDLISLSLGDKSKASSFKKALEERQREERADRKKKSAEWTPRYFTFTEKGKHGIPCWEYTGKYWEERDERIAKALATEK